MLRDDLLDSCKRAGLNPEWEPLRLLQESGTKPADVLLPSFSLGCLWQPHPVLILYTNRRQSDKE